MELQPQIENDYIKDCYPNFNTNMTLPRHRWYAFKEGFSSLLVQRAIDETKQDLGKRKLTVLDPFSGSGTTPLTSIQNGCDGIGLEVNPFMSFVSKTKCLQLSSYDSIEKELETILLDSKKLVESPLEGESTFCEKSGRDKWLFNLSVLRQYETIKKLIKESDYYDFFKLALISSIMSCCNAEKDGKCLRYKKNWQELDYNNEVLKSIFRKNVEDIICDLKSERNFNAKSKIELGSSLKSIKDISNNSINLIVFSPPYLNTFDYSDIYRPELYLGDFVKNNAELRQIREETLRSHVQVNWKDHDKSSSIWATKIASQIEEKKNELWNTNIPNMINNYFYDMEVLFKELFRVSRKGAQLWFVVGTSSYAGIEIPVDLILADITSSIGWNPISINVLRKLRTSSQCSSEEVRKIRLRESLIICKK